MSQQGKMSLSVKDVIHVEGFPGSASLFQDNATLRIKDLLSKLEAVFSQSGMLSADEVRALMQQGIPCEMLQPGAGDWQAGCIRLSLDFQPLVSAPETAASMNLQAIAAVPLSAVAAMPDASMALESMMAEDAIGDKDILSGDADDLMGGLMIDEVANLQDALTEDPFSENGLGEDTEMDMPDADLAEAIDFSDDMAMLMDDAPMAEATEESDFSDLMDESMMGSAMGDEAAIDLSDVDFMSVGEEATELEFGLDLDSQMVNAETAENLGNPWDPNAELDEMLLANGQNL
jgi:hypothetical protein